MKTQPPTRPSLTRLLSQHFVWLLLGAYAIAVAFPAAGHGIRETVVAESAALGLKLTLPLLLLGVLFVNIGIDLAGRQTQSNVSVGSIGFVVAAGWIIPLLVLLLSRTLIGPMLPRLGQELFLGMVLVAAMPIANSSSAWAHNRGADVGHSVFSLIWSTLLAPFASVLFVSWLWLDGAVGDGLRETISVQLFAGLLGGVVIPIALGAALAKLWPGCTRPAVRDASKLVNMLLLLLLNYSNAALALPQAFSERQFGSLLLALACVAMMCGLVLLSARLIGAWRRWPRALATSAALSMSMKNTGTALVLAGTVLAPGSMAILVIVAYTLVQHVLVSVAVRPVPVDDKKRMARSERVERVRQDSEPSFRDSEPPFRIAPHVAG